MREHAKSFLLGALPFLAILGVWFTVSHFALVPRWVLPSPLYTGKALWALVVSGKLFTLAWVSLQNVLIGFVFAALAAISLGILIGMYPVLRKVFFPFLATISAVPSLAWLPIIVILLGFTTSAIIAIIFLSSFKKLVYSTVSGVRNVPLNWILAGRNIGLSTVEVIWKIILPAAMPQIVTGLRLGFGSAWRSVVGAEMLVAGVNGLGRFIWNAQWLFAFDDVFSGIIMIGLIGLLVEELVFRRVEENLLIRWGLADQKG